MKNNSKDILKFILKQKYILIILLIISLIFSYLIKKNEEFLGLKIEQTSIQQDKKVKYTDYYYQIWYDRKYGHAVKYILGIVFDDLGIDKFIFPNDAKVSNPRQTNRYFYFNIHTLDPIDEDLFWKKFEFEKKNYLQGELETINDFRSFKNDKTILNNNEFQIFKAMNTKINFKKNIRIREVELSYAESEIKNLKGNEKHRSNNIEIIAENNNIEKKKEIFFYPEIIILLTYIGYFSLYFFIQLIREND